MKYISLDLETTGLNPEKCQILEIGAVLEDTAQQQTIKNLPHFHAYVRHELYSFEPFALRMNWELVKSIVYKEVETIHVEDLASRFRDWLSANGILVGSMTYAGKNFGSFDMQFLKQVPGWTDKVKMKHRAFDVGCMMWQAGDEVIPDLATCAKRAGLTEIVAHRAIDDAEMVVAIMRTKYGYKSDAVFGHPNS